MYGVHHYKFKLKCFTFKMDLENSTQKPTEKYVYRIWRRFNMHILFCLLVVSFWTGGASFASAAEMSKDIIITGIWNNEFHILAGSIIKEAYGRIGFNASIRFLPGKRALIYSSRGKVDGELSRIFEVGEQYKTLIRVPVPYLSLKGTVFFLKNNVNIGSQADLADYKSGILRGVIYSDELTSEYQRMFGNNTYQLFNLLVKNRVDLVIATEVSGKLEAAINFNNYDIKTANNPLVEIPIYHYLHEKNKHFVPLIEPVLRKMLQTGEISKMREEYIERRIGLAKLK